MPPPLGAHLSIAGGIWKALDSAKEIGADAVQIFTRSNRQWAAKPLTDEDRALLDQARERAGISRIVVHSAYLINLASDDAAVRERSAEAWQDELARCELLGLSDLVLHPGNHGQTPEQEGIQRIARSLDQAFEAVPGKTRVLLEITAGQGESNIGWKLEHLRDLLGLSRQRERLGTCFDTCHAFAAGHDLSRREGYEETMRRFDQVVGLGTIGCFHLNDAQRELGSRVDRHAPIGEGQLGTEPFGWLVNDPRFADRPMLLETPGDEALWAREIALLRRLAAGEKAATTRRTARKKKS